jgi:hypothetical protein
VDPTASSPPTSTKPAEAKSRWNHRRQTSRLCGRPFLFREGKGREPEAKLCFAACSSGSCDTLSPPFLAHLLCSELIYFCQCVQNCLSSSSSSYVVCLQVRLFHYSSKRLYKTCDIFCTLSCKLFQGFPKVSHGDSLNISFQKLKQSGFFGDWSSY